MLAYGYEVEGSPSGCSLGGATCPRMIFPLYIDHIIVSSFSLPLQGISTGTKTETVTR